MNVTFVNQLYEEIKKYVEQNSEFNPRVVQKSLKQSDKFPLITILEDDNINSLISTDFKDKTDEITITINIYAEDKVFGNKTISNVNIVKELLILVDRVCNKYKMRRTQCKPTPNLDENIYRITTKYTKKIISNKNILI